MDFTIALNNKSLNKKVNEFLSGIDTNGDNSYSKDEVKDGLKDVLSVFAKPLISDKTVGTIMKTVDKDGDGTISEQELDKFVKDKYNISLDDAKKMNVKDLAQYIQKIEKEKKSQKK